MPRFYCAATLAPGLSLELPEGAGRHVQVLRLQPGASITLFDGRGGEFDAVIDQMGRSAVRVLVQEHRMLEREVARAVHLAVAMPANERMDWLVEKATELGAVSIQPLVAERSVLRFSSERALKKRAHWQGIAIAACEQCGRNRVPVVRDVMDLSHWLAAPQAPALRLALSLAPDALPLAEFTDRVGPVLALSGPEGGLTPQEQAAALAQGFQPVTLGSRVLRAETAPVALLAAITLGR